MLDKNSKPKKLIPKLQGLSNLPNLRRLKIENNYYFILFNLLELEINQLNHLETVEFSGLIIDDAFNQFLSKTKLKKIKFTSCKFADDFKFMINLTFLRKIIFTSINNLSMKGFYESIKGNTEMISFYLAINHQFDNIKSLDNLISLLSHMKFIEIHFQMNHVLFNKIQKIKSSTDIQNMLISINSSSDPNISPFFLKLKNLESLNIL